MSDSKEKKTNEGRRAFLSKGIMLASGLILTPLWLEGCGGGDNQGAPRTPKKSKSGTPGGDGGGSGDSGGGSTTAGAYQCVEPGELASKQNVKVVVNYAGDHVAWTDPKLKMSGLTGDDGARAMGEVDVDKYYPEPSPLGTKYVVNERVLTIKEGDSVRLCNAIIVLDPRGPAKVAKNPRNDVHVDNHFFRFEPRVHYVATRGHVTWENKDPVTHAIAAPGITPANLRPVNISDQGTAAPGKKVTTRTSADALGFIQKGWYGVNCSLHAWELGRIFVSDHAYVGWSNKANKCEVSLENVADGKYELQVWHETSNTPIKTMEIEVKAGMAPVEIKLDKIS